MGRAIGQTTNPGETRTFNFSLYLSDGERKKLEKTAWLQGISINEFIRKAIEDEYKKILNEEVRQYEHSGVHSKIHKGARKLDPDHSERSWADRDGGRYGETGA